MAARRKAATPYLARDRAVMMDSPSKANCRLLWRGSLVPESGPRLHGQLPSRVPAEQER